MKREKRLTRRERKALSPAGSGSTHQHTEQHIHCVACGKHLDPENFSASAGGPPSAQIVQCAHGSQFPSCVSCVPVSKALLDEHDRTGQPVRAANAWH